MVSDTSSFTQPQLLNADTDPTLRYPIGSLVGMLCASMAYGWLDISHAGIHFKVVQPLKRLDQGFDIRTGEISEIKIWQQSIRFHSGSKKYTIFYAPEDRWESIHNCPAFFHVANLGERGTGSIHDALSNFDSVLAQVKAATAPPPPVVAPPVVNPAVTATEPKPAPSAPPAILMITPSGAGSNQVVDANDSPLTIRGFAMDAQVFPWSRSMAHPPTCGRRATRLPSSGPNRCPFSRVETRLRSSPPMRLIWKRKLSFRFVTRPSPLPVAPKGLSKEEIISLLHGEVPSSRVADLVRERGIKFSPADADLNQIRSEGGTDELIQAIQQAAAHP